MPGARQKIGEWFAALGGRVWSRPWLTLALVLGVVLLLGWQATGLRLDASTQGFLSPHDPALLDYQEFRRRFGGDETIILAVQAPDVRRPEARRRLQALAGELAREVPLLAGITLPFGPDGREGPEGLVSLDGRLAALLVRLRSAPPGREAAGQMLGEEEISAAVEAVNRVAAGQAAPGWEPLLAGAPVLTDHIRQAMVADTRLFVKLSLLVVVVLLLALFRRISGVLLPVAAVGCTVVSTLGLMTLAGCDFKLPTIILPSFLAAVGVGAGVHLLTLFYLDLDAGLERREALVHALRRSGLPILLTTLTTAAGLASFGFAQVEPVAELGLFAAAGVCLSLIFTVTLIPALLRLLPVAPRRAGRAAPPGPMSRFLTGMAVLSTSRPRLIVALGLGLALASLGGAWQIRFSHNPLDWLARDAPVRLANLRVDQALGGLVTSEVVLDTGRAGGVADPVFLGRLEELCARLEGLHMGPVKVGRVVSLGNLQEEMAGLGPGGMASLGMLSSDPAMLPGLIASLAPELRARLGRVVDPELRRTRVSLVSPWVDAVAYAPFLGEVGRLSRREMQGLARVKVTGLVPLLSRTFAAAINSAALSFLIALVVVSLMMVLLLGDLRLGLAAMLPNLLPILLALGFMGWRGVPLDMYSMLVGSIAIGLAVDDTVHFMHHFRAHRGQGEPPRRAVELTLATAGRAMLTTTLALAAGALVYLFSQMNNLFNFGLLTAAVVLLALAADYLLAPALVVLLDRDSRPEAGDQTG